MLIKDIVSNGFEYYLSIFSTDAMPSVKKTLDLPHVAFFGASNSGKSSLISSLCKVKNLSFSSKTPGKTKEILIFTPKHPFFHKKSFFTDFPGYGYAKASNATLKQWEAIPEFISQVNIEKNYILIPIKKSMSNNDIAMIESLQNKSFCIVLTKCEKSTPIEILQKKEDITKICSIFPHFTGQIFSTSARSEKNMQNLEILQEIFDIFKRRINGI